MMGFGGGFGGLFFLVIVVAFAVWGGRTLLAKHESKGGAPSSALEVLSHRYASGEIDREEFERMKKDLSA
ncbi:MAG TPA: SHOCT domain-containing protein [Desulfuromonadales bacterium]|nr:SHOCT domain-containing protein [Desulfuromonadales bacterium]